MGSKNSDFGGTSFMDAPLVISATRYWTGKPKDESVLMFHGLAFEIEGGGGGGKREECALNLLEWLLE